MRMPDCDHRERDRCWLRRICRGDEEAFEALFLAYYTDLCRFAARYVSSSDVVEDLIQDIFLSVWKRRETLDPQQNIRAYLYKATRNEAFKHLNRKRVRKRYRDRRAGEELPVRAGPEEAFRHRELEVAVQEALDALPERRCHIFVLSRQHGLTYAEIADLLDISIKTVETQMGRALRMLEKHLSKFLSVLL